MRLTVYTDYALRVLMYLSVHTDPLPTIAEIADSYRISRSHVMKVAFELGQAGYIETMRGKKGGLKLARAPSEIRLGEVIRRTEPDMALVSCFEPAKVQCVLSSDCRLRSALYQAQAAFLEVLDRFTVADLVAHRTVLLGLLERGSHAEDDRQDASPRVPDLT